MCLEFHPRDIGKILIGYLEGAVIYSFKQNEPRKTFQYHVPRGAPGGDSDPASVGTARSPKLTQATWHPTGTFVITGHEDSSLVIWDPKDGRIIMARTTTDTNVNQPGSASFGDSGRFTPKSPLLKIKWCANQDPDDTGILVAGGTSASMPTRGLTFLELGRTPNYGTTAWPQLSAHFENPKRQRVLPTPPQVEVVNFCLIPRKTPWYAGAHDPIAVLALLATGEITSLSFPSGFPITPTNLLHVSMSFVHPFVDCTAYASIDRARWLGMSETRHSGQRFLLGGVEATQTRKRYVDRSIVQTAHADGTIRIWDAGHADEIENGDVVQADVCRAVGRFDDVKVTKLSLSDASSELAAGLQSGELVVFRWSRNTHPGREPPPASHNQPQALTDVTDRKDPTLVEGFHPFTLLDQQDGPVTALKVSDVGFVAAGFEGGSFAVIDMRGPAIIMHGNINEYLQKDKSGPFRRKSGASQMSWPSTLEFSVMTLDNDGYSSILLHVGTNIGHVVTFKILPGQGGRYSVQYAGFNSLEDLVIAIIPINATSGQPAYASQSAVGSLRDGFKVDGALLVVTKTEARIFRPASAKGAHKSWDGALCYSATITECLDRGLALVGLFGDGTAKSFTLPGLKEVASVKVNHALDVKAFGQAAVNKSGDIIGWSGPSELALLNVWGTGED